MLVASVGALSTPVLVGTLIGAVASAIGIIVACFRIAKYVKKCRESSEGDEADADDKEDEEAGEEANATAGSKKTASAAVVYKKTPFSPAAKETPYSPPSKNAAANPG